MNKILKFSNKDRVKRKKNISISQMVKESQKYSNKSKSKDTNGAFTERDAYLSVQGDYDELERNYNGPLEYDAMWKFIMEESGSCIRHKGGWTVIKKKHFHKITLRGYAKEWCWGRKRVISFVNPIIERLINFYIKGKQLKADGTTTVPEIIESL